MDRAIDTGGLVEAETAMPDALLDIHPKGRAFATKDPGRVMGVVAIDPDHLVDGPAFPIQTLHCLLIRRSLILQRIFSSVS